MPAKKSEIPVTPPAEPIRSALVRKLIVHAKSEGDTLTAVPSLILYRRSSPTSCTSAAYQPSFVLFLEGQKRINLGRTTYLCGAGNFLLTSLDLPVVSQVVAATPETPLLGLILRLEISEVRRILSAEELPGSSAQAQAHPDLSIDPGGMAIGVASAELLNACLRLIDLLDTPHDIPFLAALIQQEIIYRLLRSPQGAHLRAIATLGDQSHRTAKAVSWLRMNYARPLRIEQLATMAQMGVSTLHHHFRSLTSMSPLQYQKHLRLHVARERMLNDGLDAATAAYEVGYESPSQFNREYSRFFGQPPMRDIKSRRSAIAAAD